MRPLHQIIREVEWREVESIHCVHLYPFKKREIQIKTIIHKNTCNNLYG